MHRFSKHYTLDEARALLPKIRRWLADLEACQKILSNVEKRIGYRTVKHEDVGGPNVNELVRTLADCKDILQKFAGREIQIDNLRRGLIDFPSLREGREIFLCWEKDEDDIEFWHDLDSGYAGRERVYEDGKTTCQNGPYDRHLRYMSVAAEKVAEVLGIAGYKTGRSLPTNLSPVSMTRWMLAPKRSGPRSLTGAPASSRRGRSVAVRWTTQFGTSGAKLHARRQPS